MIMQYDYSVFTNNVAEISKTAIFYYWENFLWKNRQTPIEDMSAMTLDKSYTTDISDPLFYGVIIEGRIVGVNSVHRVKDTIRSRGLWVNEAYRNSGYGTLLTAVAIGLANGKKIWSFPRQEALQTYTRSGFKKSSDFIFDELENKFNCYVEAN